MSPVIHQPSKSMLQRNAHYLLDIEIDDLKVEDVECIWNGEDFKTRKPLHGDDDLFIGELETLQNRVIILSIRNIV